MTTDFKSFGLPETLLAALEKINFTTPTPIQAQSIPPALQGQDVLGTASTGTGKTAAFALPMMTHLINNPKSVALVMTPTRELATQVMATIQPLRLMHKDLFTACLIGGESINKQLAQLDRRPRLIVGTPGRINDHLDRGSLWLDRADFLVLDETDRMLDMGFGIQIETIIDKMAKKRQTLMFSATLPKEIVAMSGRYLKNPQRITVGEVNKPAAKIKSVEIETTDAGKFDALVGELDSRKGTVIIFVKTRYGTEKLAKKLRASNYAADAIHGDLQQRKRDRVIADFRDKKFRILVATDVAARGLDIPHIEHVINHDLPQAPEDYIHRIGRTARAGAEGEAVNLITPAEGSKWRAIQKLINPEQDRNERANRTADRNSPRRGDARGRKPQGGDRQRSQGGERRWGRDEAPAGRSPWESKKRGSQSSYGDRDSKPKRSFSRNPFEQGQELESAYREVREQRDNYRDEPRQERGERSYGARREGGFGQRREGGFGQRREGGFGERREGGRGERSFGQRREGGFGGRREGGFGEGREGGRGERSFGQRREGGFGQRREGGFGEGREGGRGERSFGQRREGGFGQRREGGFGEGREGGRGERSFGERRDGGRRDGARAPAGKKYAPAGKGGQQKRSFARKSRG